MGSVNYFVFQNFQKPQWMENHSRVDVKCKVWGYTSNLNLSTCISHKKYEKSSNIISTAETPSGKYVGSHLPPLTLVSMPSRSVRVLLLLSLRAETSGCSVLNTQVSDFHVDPVKWGLSKGVNIFLPCHLKDSQDLSINVETGLDTSSDHKFISTCS